MACTHRRSVIPFGAAATLALSALAVPASAHKFEIIHDFTGDAEGGVPGYTLAVDGQHRFLGTANQGGNGYGTVFLLTHNAGAWTVKSLYDFTGDQGQPGWGIVLGTGGIVYVNSSYASVMGGPCGSALALDPAAKHAPAKLRSTLLHTYVKADDGCPTGNLLQDSAGSLFGVTQNGGANAWGSVFELNPSDSGWTETILYSFRGEEDGGGPYSELVMDGPGNLYGTASASAVNFGTVFELSPSGSTWTYKVLHAFSGGNDGGQPVAALTFDPAGNLYGATTSFGRKGGGTIFELSPSGDTWRFHVLHNLSGSDGPVAALTLDPLGTLYGTNFMDGAYGCGSVFRLKPVGGKWRYADLHDFTGGADGGYPGGGVVFDASGNLFGTAVLGGAYGYGVIYKAAP